MSSKLTPSSASSHSEPASQVDPLRLDAEKIEALALPEIGRHAEKARQTQCGAWSDAALVVHQFFDALIRRMQRIRQVVLGDLQRFQELFREHFAEMSRGSVCGNAEPSVFRSSRPNPTISASLRQPAIGIVRRQWGQ